MQEPTLDWDSLAEGREFPAASIVLDDASIDAYLEATGERHPLYARDAGGGLAPPLFTTMVRFVKASLGGRWPSGTIQLDHQVSMRRALRRGENLSLETRCGRVDVFKGRPRFEILSTLRDADGAVAGAQSSASLWGGAPPPPAARVNGPDHSPDHAAGSATNGELQASADEVADEAAALGPVTDSYPMARVRAFGEIALALDPIHVDTEFAQSTRFGANIVQGRLAMTLLSRLMLQHQGSRWLNGGHLDVRFVRPVRVGEAISAWALPMAGRPRAFRVWCENANHQRVIEGEAGIGP